MILRQVRPEGISYDTLEDLRFKIDKYDNELLDILQKRMEVAESIGTYKKQTNMTILQPNRWEEVVENSLVKDGLLINTTLFDFTPPEGTEIIQQ